MLLQLFVNTNSCHLNRVCDSSLLPPYVSPPSTHHQLNAWTLWHIRGRTPPNWPLGLLTWLIPLNPQAPYPSWCMFALQTGLQTHNSTCCISITCHVMYLTSGKLAAVMHVAVILQDCLARHTVIVLAKPCASILSPNMRMKLDMIMRMKVIVRRKRGVRENG